MILLAHRGLRLAGPENSLDGARGVAKATRQDLPLGIEFDVIQTADSVLVCAHDTTVALSDSSEDDLTIAETWYSQVQAILGDTHPPRLPDVLEVVAQDVPLVDVDVRERGYETDVVDATRIIPRDRLMISSHIPSVVRKLGHLVDEGARVGLLVFKYWHGSPGDMMALMHDVGANVLFFHQNFLTKDLVDAVHNDGSEVGSYTINDPARLNHAIDLGVDFPCTNHPELIFEELLP